MDEVGRAGDLRQVLTRRLDGAGPLGVAVSGGGDSLALLYMLADWGRRPLHVFCVDHGIHPDSAAWTQAVAAHAARAGARFTALRWAGSKPATGLSAAARQARHRLLADAARTAGIRVLCLAHTRDDVLEAAWMRDHGSNVGTPAEWAPSPVWPQGRGVFLLRPLLGARRENLRSYLTACGIGWIDDPANANPLSLRARARSAEKNEPPMGEIVAVGREWMNRLLDRQWAAHGLIALHRTVFDSLPGALSRRVMAAAAVCAGGGERLPRGDGVDGVLAGLASGKARTLCGARIWRTATYIFAAREAGDIGRNDAGTVSLVPGAAAFWDGRYAIRTATSGTIRASGRARGELGEADRAELRRLPAAVRGILPVFDPLFPEAALPGPRLLGQTTQTGVDCVNWVVPRFVAACGAVDRESRIGPYLAESDPARA